MRPGRQVDWGELAVSSSGPMNLGSPREVNDLYAGVTSVLNSVCSNGRRVGDCKYGVYLFRDYDGSRSMWDRPQSSSAYASGGI